MDLHRMVIIALSVICCLCVGGIVIVQVTGQEPNPLLGYIATASSGALVGILVPARSH